MHPKFEQPDDPQPQPSSATNPTALTRLLSSSKAPSAFSNPAARRHISNIICRRVPFNWRAACTRRAFVGPLSVYSLPCHAHTSAQSVTAYHSCTTSSEVSSKRLKGCCDGTATRRGSNRIDGMRVGEFSGSTRKDALQWYKYRSCEPSRLQHLSVWSRLPGHLAFNQSARRRD